MSTVYENENEMNRRIKIKIKMTKTGKNCSPFFASRGDRFIQWNENETENAYKNDNEHEINMKSIEINMKSK